MRWVVFCFAALFAAAVSLSAAAQADGNNVTIKVTVLGADGKPVPDAHLLVRAWPDPLDSFYLSDRGTTKGDGSFSDADDAKGRPFPSDTYEITASTDGGYAKTIVYISSDRKSPIVLTLGPKPGEFAEHAAKAAAAAEGGDSAGYQQSVKDAQNSIKLDEKAADDAQQAADDLARDNGLQIKDLRAVTKDIERARKVPENLQDKERLQALVQYQNKLLIIHNLRLYIEQKKKQLAELKPPEKKFGLAPSACPEGQSGGLLAGGINSVFGSDLAGVCDEEMQRRRDTDRPSGGKHDKHERKD